MTAFWRWAIERLIDLLGRELRRTLAATETDRPIAWGKRVSPESAARPSRLPAALASTPAS